MADVLSDRRRIVQNAPYIKKLIAAPLQKFSTDMLVPLKECKIYFSPVQEGTGDPSPDNVRPITGWTGIEVENIRKNIFDYVNMTRIDGYYYGDTGIYDSSNLSGYFAEYIPVRPNTQYTISGTIRNAIYFYTQDKIWISKAAVANAPRTFTTPANCHYIRVQYRMTDVEPSTVQIEEGTIATTYEPYQGTIVRVDWSDFAGTIYGGYIDLIKDELVQTHKSITLDGTEVWGAYGSVERNDFCASITINDKKIGEQTSICDKLVNTNSCYAPYNYGKGKYCDHQTLKNIYVCMPDASITTLEGFKEWLANNHIQFTYELETPIHYPLTPTQLKTLRGANNIWSNANGNIELKYWTH